MSVQGENSLLFKAGWDNSGLLQGKLDGMNIISSFASQVSKINPFVGFAVASAAAFAMISKGAYDMAKEFEHAMKEVETISQATQDNFDLISKQVFAISNISPDSPKALAEAYYQIVSAGYDGAEGLKLLEIAAMAAVAGVTTTETAADGLTTVLNAFKKSAGEAEQVADVLFQTVKLGKTDFEQLSTNLATVAPLAAASGIAFEEVAAAVATLTKQGVPTAQAMTQIRASIIALNENLSDGWSSALTFQDALQLVYESAGGSQNELRKLTGSVEAMGAVLAVAGTNIEGAKKDLESYKNVAGSTAKANQTLLGDSTNQWKLFSNNVRAYTKDLGDEWLKVGNSLATFLNKAFDDPLAKSEIFREQVEQQRERIILLKGELKKLNTEGEERLQFIRDMKSEFPEFLGSLDAEKATNSELLKILDSINETYKIRYKFQQREQQFKDELTKQGDIEIKIEDFEDKFAEKIAETRRIAEDNGIPVKIEDPEMNFESIQSFFAEIKKGYEAAGISVNSKVNKDFVTLQRSVSQYATSVGELNVELKTQSGIVDDLAAKNERLLKADLSKEEARLEIIKQINAAKAAEDIVKFNNTGYDDIQKAYGSRLKVLEKLDKISQVTRLADLKQYLKDENKEIQAAAELKEKALSVKFIGGDKDKKVQTFESELNDMEKVYQQFARIVENGTIEDVAAFIKANDIKGNSFQDYLRFQLTQLNKFSKDYFTVLGRLEDKSELKIQIKPTIAAGSSTDFTKQNKETEAQVVAFNAKLIGLNRSAESELVLLRKERTKAFRDMSTEELKIESDKLKAIIKKAKENGDEGTIKSAKSELKDLNQELAFSAQNIIFNATDGLRGAAELLRKFGEEDVAQILDQLAGVGEGIQEIMKGNIVGGVFDILNSAITVEVDSDTEKFEKQIAKMTKQLEKVYRELARAIGDDQIKGRIEALRSELEIQQEKERAVQAELDARKKIKVLGVTVGSKGRGSGTDQDKLEELQASLDDTKDKILDVQDELRSLLTGTTSQGISDAIIKGFEDGKTSIQDFAGTFEDLMKEAILNAFKLKAIDKLVQPFFEEFARLSDDNNDGTFDLTAAEIAALRSNFDSIIVRSNQELEALNQILGQAGIAGGVFGANADDQNSLSGAIKSITEDTANVLAGTLNAIRLDVRELYEISQNGLNELKGIRENTKYNRFLESMDTKLSNIETALG